ncbi:Uncharacterised protein [Enterobacter cancerogenus]|uniref:Uncharacterized protein n=1 Tax=Enterobacter cancerogenus TaxID=69218 RepID=A0A484YZ93_9ENTR|nr:Uncharacterised protein [Enterobacter cancerogenus]
MTKELALKKPILAHNESCMCWSCANRLTMKLRRLAFLLPFPVTVG